MWNSDLRIIVLPEGGKPNNGTKATLKVAAKCKIVDNPKWNSNHTLENINDNIPRCILVIFFFDRNNILFEIKISVPGSNRFLKKK